MRKHFKVLSLVLACAMVIGCATTAFAAEPTKTDSSATVEDVQEIPVVFEESDTITPFKQNDEIAFNLGETGYISNCGNNPKFRMWVTGGSADTQVKFDLTTSGGTAYNGLGPIKGDGSNYMEKQYIVLNGGGAWQFRAYISSPGSDTSGLVCHVKQVY